MSSFYEWKPGLRKAKWPLSGQLTNDQVEVLFHLKPVPSHALCSPRMLGAADDPSPLFWSPPSLSFTWVAPAPGSITSGSLGHFGSKRHILRSLEKLRSSANCRKGFMFAPILVLEGHLWCLSNGVSNVGDFWCSVLTHYCWLSGVMGKDLWPGGGDRPHVRGSQSRVPWPTVSASPGTLLEVQIPGSTQTHGINLCGWCPAICHI